VQGAQHVADMATMCIAYTPLRDWLRRRFMPIVVGALATAPVGAIEVTDRVDLHGYGFQSTMQTSGGNTYYGADNQGNWDNNFIGLVATVSLTDTSKLWAQLQSSSNRGNDVTWFFVDYQASDAVRLHAGRVRLPLGFYNETIAVKSLQLSTLEPSLYQIYRTGADMVHDAYHGVGVDVEHETGVGHLLWQAWAGNVYDREQPDDSRDRRAWGGRLTWNTPLDGLNLMLSAYRTRVELLEHHVMTNEDRAIAGIEFVRGPWDLKAEYAWHKAALHEFGDHVFGTGWYVQAGYTSSGDLWTPFVRYDHVTTDRSRRDDPSYTQRTVAVGLTYKLTLGVDLRVENHFNRGYGLPVSSGEVEAGAGQRRWSQFVAAINFKF
jgi:hypothetical protein